MSNRSSSIIPIPSLIADTDLIPLVNERLLRVDQELGRLDTRINTLPTATTAVTVEANIILSAISTAPVVGGAGYANVTGCRVTLTKAGKWIVHATLRGIINIGGAILVGQILNTPVVGAPAALPRNIVLLGAAGHHATVSQTWNYTATLSDQLDLQMVGVGTGTDPVTPGVGYSSTLTAIWVSP